MTKTQEMLILLDIMKPWTIEDECEKRRHDCVKCGMTKICEGFREAGLLPVNGRLKND